MNSPRTLFVTGLAVGVLLGAAVVRFVWTPSSSNAVDATASRTASTADDPGSAASSTPLSANEARRFSETLAQVRREYVDEIPDDKLIDGAMRGMLSGLDAHSAYLDRREFEEIRRGAAGWAARGGLFADLVARERLRVAAAGRARRRVAARERRRRRLRNILH